MPLYTYCTEKNISFKNPGSTTGYCMYFTHVSCCKYCWPRGIIFCYVYMVGYGPDVFCCKCSISVGILISTMNTVNMIGFWALYSAAYIVRYWATVNCVGYRAYITAVDIVGYWQPNIFFCKYCWLLVPVFFCK